MTTLLNTKIFNQVVAAAKAAAASQPAWVRAIDKAAAELAHPYTYWAFDGQVLTIKSPTSKKLYRVANDCQCEAYAKGTPCKHRAARKLMARYMEALAAADKAGATAPVAHPAHIPSTEAERNAAVLIKRTPKGETYNGIDI